MILVHFSSPLPDFEDLEADPSPKSIEVKASRSPFVFEAGRTSSSSVRPFTPTTPSRLVELLGFQISKFEG